MSLNASYGESKIYSLMVANLIYFYTNQTFINKNFNRFHKIHTQVFVEQWYFINMNIKQMQKFEMV